MTCFLMWQSRASRRYSMDNLGQLSVSNTHPSGIWIAAKLLDEIKSTNPDVARSFMTGDINVSFYRELANADISATPIPIVAFRRANPIYLQLSWYIPTLIMVAVLFGLHLTRRQERIGIVIGIGVVFALDFGIPLISQRGKGTYSETLSAMNRAARTQLSAILLIVLDEQVWWLFWWRR